MTATCLPVIVFLCHLCYTGLTLVSFEPKSGSKETGLTLVVIILQSIAFRNVLETVTSLLKISLRAWENCQSQQTIPVKIIAQMELKTV